MLYYIWEGGIILDIESIIKEGISKGASDIHLVKGHLPLFRINKELVPMSNAEKLSQFDIEYIYRYFINIFELNY